MNNQRTIRHYQLERDAEGKVCTMLWLGDAAIPTKAEQEAAKLAGWEAIYGKRQA